MYRYKNGTKRLSDLSSLRLETMARMSTACSRISCCMAIFIAMKQPVRPIPALHTYTNRSTMNLTQT